MISGFIRNFVANREYKPKIMKSRLLYIALLLIAFATETRADNLGYSKDHPLVFGIDIDYPPLEYVDANGAPKGYDVTFTKKLMERLNIPYTYAPNSWYKISNDVLSGKVDLAMMVFSPYRQDSTNYSRAVFRLYYQMITREGESEKMGLRNIKGKNIAMMPSRPIKDTLNKVGANIIIIDDLKQAVIDLSKGKYDGVLCFRYQARYLMEHNNLENLESEDLTLMPREYCYVSPNKKLIDAINDELDAMEREGVIEDVYAPVKTNLDGFRIPTWVWFLILVAIIAILLLFIYQQLRSKRLLQAEMLRVQKSEEDAKKSEENARKSEELKTIFFSNVSHALRTPLNAIIGFSDLLLDGDTDVSKEEQKHLVGLINENGLQLLHMINELLSLSDIEGKQTLFERQVTDVDYEMSQYAAEIRPQLAEGVNLVVEEPVGGMRALLDPKLLRMITMHFLENASQHTKEGQITLSYYVKEGGFYLEVKDTGSGLPEELKDNIFTLLSEKNTYLQDETPGLGLTICKAIIERSGGKIGAEDNKKDGHGTIIWFWAPVEIIS